MEMQSTMTLLNWLSASADLVQDVLGIRNIQQELEDMKIKLDTLMTEMSAAIQLMQDHAAQLRDTRTQLEQLSAQLNENDPASIQQQIDAMVAQLHDAEAKANAASQKMDNAASTIPATGEATVSGGGASDTVSAGAGADTLTPATGNQTGTPAAGMDTVTPAAGNETAMGSTPAPVGVADDQTAAENPAGVPPPAV